MKKIYLVQNKKTREILNLKDGWSDKPTSYRVMEFDSEAAAKAAFPAGVECVIAVRNVNEEPKAPKETPEPGAHKLGATAPMHQFFLQKGNKFLDKADAFKARGFDQESTQSFPSQDAALDKAESLGLDLDEVYVVKSKVRETRGPEASNLRNQS